MVLAFVKLTVIKYIPKLPIKEEAEMRREKGQKGFTLIEIIVVIAVIGILTCTLTPLLFSYITDSKNDRAKMEARMLSTTIAKLYADVGAWPFKKGHSKVDVLFSHEENRPDFDPGAGWDTSKYNLLGNILFCNDPNWNGTPNERDDYPMGCVSCGPSWRGPYYDRFSFVDPWGHSYVINAKYFPGGNGECKRVSGSGTGTGGGRDEDRGIGIDKSLGSKAVSSYAGCEGGHCAPTPTVLVCSAGKNGLLETTFDGTKVKGDDICYAITTCDDP